MHSAGAVANYFLKKASDEGKPLQTRGIVAGIVDKANLDTIKLMRTGHIWKLYVG